MGELSADCLDKILAFEQVLFAPGFKPAEWQSSYPKEIDGKTVYMMPYPEYDDAVWQFFAACASCGVHPYDRLPEDGDAPDPIDLVFSPDYFGSASARQVLRYFSLCTRRERFGDGHIDSQFGNGCLAAAFARLRVLRDTL